MSESFSFWQWIPTLENSIYVEGPGRIVDDYDWDLDQYQRIVDNLTGDGTHVVCGLLSYRFEGNDIFFIPVDYSEGPFVDAIIVMKSKSKYDLLGEASLELEREGLLSVELLSMTNWLYENLEDFMYCLIEEIIRVYHTHIHPSDFNTIEPFRGDDRQGALEWICNEYEVNITDGLSAYRDNPKDLDMYFQIKSHLLYSRSFLDKYGEELEESADNLEYLGNYVGESVDMTYRSREYKVDHESTENLKSLNNRMFILTITSIIVAFFAGSILNDAFDNRLKLTVTVVAAIIIFVAVTLSMYALRWYQKKEQEDDGYDEQPDDRFIEYKTYR